MEKKECQMCDGTGQIRFFAGVSRFQLTWEDCPECGGLGYELDGNQAPLKNGSPAGKSNKKN